MTDWLADVKKYVHKPNEAAVHGIIKHCGIALNSRDGSLVSFTDEEEVNRVKESFCVKTLGLTNEKAIDAAIVAVGARMKLDNTRNRVTVYYLLAEHFDKLAQFE